MNFKAGTLLKDMLTYGLGDLLGRAGMLISLPIYTRIFSNEDYGVLTFILTAIGFASTVMIVGADSAYARHFFDARTDEERKVVTTTCLGFLLFWGILSILAALPFVEYFSQWSFGRTQEGRLYTYALLAIPLTHLNTICGQAIRNQFRPGLFAVLNGLTVSLTVTFGLIGVLILEWGLEAIFAGTVLSLGLVLPVRLWFIRSLIGRRFSFRLLKAILSYGAPLVPASIAYWVFSGCDRILLGKFTDMGTLGLFSVAVTMTSILTFANSALGQAWSPHAFRLYQEDPRSAAVTFGKVLVSILVLFGILAVITSTFALELVVLLASPKFGPASVVVGPLCLGAVALASTQVTCAGISLSKQTRYLAIHSWTAALLNIGLNYLAIPYFGMIGAAWATVLSYTVLTISYFVTTQRLFPIVLDVGTTMLVILLVSTFTLGSAWIPEMELYKSLAIKTGYCVIFLVLLFLVGVIRKQNWIGKLSETGSSPDS